VKNITKLLISFLLLQTLLYATNEEIPDGALRLIKKLTAWEEDLEKKFLEEKSLKRKQVIVALNSELDRATRKGDLNGALALRNYIDELSSNNSINDSVSFVKAEDNNLSAAIADTQWTWPLGGGNSTVTFIDGNKLRQSGGSGQQSYQSTLSWKQIDDYTIEFERKGEWATTGSIEFDRDFETAKISVRRKSGLETKSKIERIKTY
jgi:hypothetical protein